MSTLQDVNIDRLLTRLDELVRWRPGSKGQYQDLYGAVARLKGSANHIILGRRGSGKTRLLDELKSAVEKENAIVIAVGAEDFKELTYPDILIQILRSFLREFLSNYEKHIIAFTRNWWREKWFAIIHPIKQKERKHAIESIRAKIISLIKDLDDLLVESDDL